MDKPSPRLLPQELRRAWVTQFHDPADDANVYAEDVALAIEGRIDLVPEARREALLRAIATDPDWATVIAELREDASAAQGRQRDDQEASPVIGRVDAQGAHTPFQGFMKFSRWVGSAGAIAACFTLAMVAWRFADPPAPPPPTGVRSTDAGTEFPWRDLLTVLFAMLTLMLLAVWTLQALIAFRHADD